jgi:hypothetical protein
LGRDTHARHRPRQRDQRPPRRGALTHRQAPGRALVPAPSTERPR